MQIQANSWFNRSNFCIFGFQDAIKKIGIQREFTLPEKKSTLDPFKEKEEDIQRIKNYN